MKDIYIIKYGGKWGWKFKTGVVQKLYKTLDEALHYGWQIADSYQSDLYLEVKPDKFIKQKRARRSS